MKDLKPSRIETEIKEDNDFAPSPQRIDENFEEFEEKNDNKKEKNVSKNSSLKIVLIISFLSIFIIGSIYNIFESFNSILNYSLVLGTIYIISFITFALIILYFIFKQYKGYSKLKDLENLQKKAKEFAKNPSSEIFPFAKEIISVYKNHENDEIKEIASKLEKEIEQKVFLKEEILDILDEKLFSFLDKKAYNIISKYSTQTAFSTAISPVAIIDMLLILSRSWVMITKIAQLYGYKPNFTGKIVLLKRVSFNLIFASITDLASDYLSSIIGTSVLSKLSYHTAQGLANGVLTARVGVATISACRILYLKKRINYVQYIAKKLLDTLLGKGQAA